MTAYTNLRQYIYKGYYCKQNDSVNSYVLPVYCQKVMANHINSFISNGL